MNLLAEISMYPLDRDYIAPIDAFLEHLNARQDPARPVEVQTGRMSTLLYGDYGAVMALLGDAMAAAQAEDASAVFVCKFIPGAARSVGEYT